MDGTDRVVRGAWSFVVRFWLIEAHIKGSATRQVARITQEKSGERAGTSGLGFKNKPHLAKIPSAPMAGISCFHCGSCGR